jgi:hypothetical protein
MKKPGILLLLVILVLVTLVGSKPGRRLGLRTQNCSYQGEVCIRLSLPPSFDWDEPVPLQITVTSTRDLTDLHVNLHTSADIAMDGPETWEKSISNPYYDRFMALWDFDIQAGQAVTFNRVLHFPSRQAYLDVDADVINPGKKIDASDSVVVVLFQQRGEVIRSMEGTPIPLHTPEATSPVYGPGTITPTHIHFHTPTRWREPAEMTQTSLAPLFATPTLRTSPYPPPDSVTPSLAPYP